MNDGSNKTQVIEDIPARQEGQAIDHKQNCLMQRVYNCWFEEADEHHGEQLFEPVDWEL